MACIAVEMSSGRRYAGRVLPKTQSVDHLKGLLGQVNVLYCHEASTEGRHCAVPHNGGADSWQHICQQGQVASSQQHQL